MVTFAPELLQHAGCAAEREAAPATPVVADPRPRCLESQAVDVQTAGRFQVIDPEQGHGLPDVRCGFGDGGAPHVVGGGASSAAATSFQTIQCGPSIAAPRCR